MNSTIPAFFSRTEAVLGLTLTVAAGFLVSRGYGAPLLAASLCAGLVYFGVRRNIGVVIAVLLLAQLQGLPLIHPSKSAESALLLLELIAIGVYLATHPPKDMKRTERLVLAIAALNLAWWVFVAARTYLLAGGTVAGILAGGRDLTYIPLLASACMLVFKQPNQRTGFCVAFALGTAVFLVARSLYGFNIHLLDSVLNVHHITVSQGLPRIYTPMNSVATAAAALGAAAGVLGSTPRVRRFGGAIGLLGLLVIALQLTRAQYFGIGLGFFVGGAVWITSPSRLPSHLRFRIPAVAGSVALLVVLYLIVGAGHNGATPLHVIGDRLEKGVADLTMSTGTVGIRKQTAHAIFEHAGTASLSGLGFWSPSVRYFANLPFGDLRNGDVGFLNIYVTEGLVGTILLYGSLLAVLGALLRFPRRGGLATPPSISVPRDAQWLVLGLAIWLIAVLASSLTLVDLFSRPGGELSGVLLGLALGVLASTPGSPPRTLSE
jgi:hypothetical protein